MSKDEFINAAATLNLQKRATCPRGEPPQLYCRHHRYPPLLTTLFLTAQDKPDHDERIAKFIVDTLKRLWLALAGPSSAYVPSYAQMTPSLMRPTAYSAGKVFFKKGEIIGLSDESDFTPMPHNLLWPVIILDATGAPISSNLSIISMGHEPFELTPGDRKEIIAQLPIEMLRSLLHVNRGKTVHVREGVYTRNATFSAHTHEPHITEARPEDILNQSMVELALN